MKLLTDGLTLFVALQHVAFLVIEMFLWRTPVVRKSFGMSEQLAQDSYVLAMNQGLYNGFLAAGLVWGWSTGQPQVVTFFLACVVVAGIFGGATAKPTIFVIQALPAAIALGLHVWGPR
jgi:putative membrane protein